MIRRGRSSTLGLIRHNDLAFGILGTAEQDAEQRAPVRRCSRDAIDQLWNIGILLHAPSPKYSARVSAVLVF
jgi:hypothetical protein